MRVGIFGVGVMSMIMGIVITSIYELWFLCGDLVYVILFPQLVSVIYLKGTNTYGSLSGYVIGLLLRMLGGEKTFHLPALIHYPGYDPVEEVQNFPYKTMTMLISLTVIVIVSYPAKYLFENHIFPKHWDVFQCIVNIPDEMIILKEPTEGINVEIMAINAKHNAPGANGQINPALKLNRDDLLLTANYQRLQESRSPSPLPDPRERIPSAGPPSYPGNNKNAEEEDEEEEAEREYAKDAAAENSETEDGEKEEEEERIGGKTKTTTVTSQSLPTGK